MPKALELSGEKFGKLTVIEKTDKKQNGSILWKCKCDCGSYTYVKASHLKAGNTTSCGRCLSNQDLSGRRFGRLIAKRIAYRKRNFNYWLCQCDCGKEKIIRNDSLIKGSTRSCGCLASETATKLNTKHNKWGTRLYNIWNGMKQRCENENDTTYRNYGMREISVCDEWRDFEPFYDWAMANGYDDNLSIDRIYVNGNYEPSNCRWATREEQDRNKRNTWYITFNKKRMCATDWEIELGFPKGTFYRRIKKLDWSIEKAFTTKIDERYDNRRKSQHDGIKNL